ncbi:hypothetical protein PInf_007824 [Phytophthora infestans]|nr:hypothetical protein PInf_007824 [Phytophthora infestans]
MASTDNSALYERILSLVDPTELYRSSNLLLQEECSSLAKSMSDIFASFTKVEEVRDAVNQLEQGKASTGRSETLLEAMNSTLQLQQKLNEKLQKVVSGMNAEDLKVKEKETHLEKRTRHETDDNDNDSSSDSSSSSSSNDEDDEEEIDQRKKRKLPEKPTLSGKKDSADLSLAHKALDTISKIKVVNRRIDLEITRALGRAVVVFREIRWTHKQAMEVQSLITALSGACSKNEVLGSYFHRARAELESLKMTISQSVSVASQNETSDSPKVEDQLQTFEQLVKKAQTRQERGNVVHIVQALDVMRHVMAEDTTCAYRDKGYVRYASSITVYSKNLQDHSNQVGWQSLADTLLKSVSEKKKEQRDRMADFL